jgi:hypothetical protein
VTRLSATAIGKKLGLLFIKQAQVHPIEQQRRDATFNRGQRSLLDELGYGQSPEGQAKALTESGDYYERIRRLYDQIYGALDTTEGTAGEKETKVLSVPQ